MHESVWDYISEKLQLIDRTEQVLAKKQLVFQVQASLLVEIEHSMVGHTVKTMESLMKLVISIEVALQMNHAKIKNRNWRIQ